MEARRITNNQVTRTFPVQKHQFSDGFLGIILGGGQSGSSLDARVAGEYHPRNNRRVVDDNPNRSDGVALGGCPYHEPAAQERCAYG
jgi:hypothetical protein